MLKNICKYRYLLKEIVRKNIKLQYRNSILGVFWTFLQPLLTTLVLVLVFSRIFGKDSSAVLNYPVYLLCGRLIYEFYTQSTKRAMRSIVQSASVIKKVYIPKYIYPLSNVISTFTTFLISLSVLVVFIAYFQLFSDSPVNLTGYAFLAFVPIIILFLLCVGVGLILSVLEVFFKDVEYLYDVFCMLIFYFTPIFYNVKQLKLDNTLVLRTMMANPLYSIVSMFRSCVLFGEMWNWSWFWYSLAFSVICIITGSVVFWRYQDKFILHI
jgi:ABC-2 type transport system permease protein